VLGDPRESGKEAPGVSARGFVGVACTLEGRPPSLYASSGVSIGTESVVGDAPSLSYRVNSHSVLQI